MPRKIGDPPRSGGRLGLVLAVLSYPAARYLVKLLAEAPRTPNELTEHFDISRAQAKNILETFVKRGLASRSEGDVYRINNEGLILIDHWLAETLSDRQLSHP